MNNTVSKIREFAAEHPRLSRGAIVAAAAVIALDTFTATAATPEEDHGTIAAVSVHHDEIGRPLYPVAETRTILDDAGKPRLPFALDLGHIVTKGSRQTAGAEPDLRTQVSQINIDGVTLDSVEPEPEEQNFDRPSDLEKQVRDHGHKVEGNQPQNRPGIATVGGYTFPLRTTKSALIGKGWCYKNPRKSCHSAHPAVDLIVKPGTEIVAMKGGTIITHKRNNWKCSTSRGNLGFPSMQIKGDDGRYYFYAHFEQGSMRHGPNKRVRQGEKLGVVGRAACGNGTPHLHIQWAGRMIEGNNQSDSIQAPIYKSFQKLPE
jgi:murein DD-endopeptidase MepM/ murein hydrolase activator NlpD